MMDVTFVTGSKHGDFQHIFIPLFSDNIVENTEYFQLHLSSNSPLSTIDGQREVSTVEIVDLSG